MYQYSPTSTANTHTHMTNTHSEPIFIIKNRKKIIISVTETPEKRAFVFKYKNAYLAYKWKDYIQLCTRN